MATYTFAATQRGESMVAEIEHQRPGWLSRHLVWISLTLVVVMVFATGTAVNRLRQNAWSDARSDAKRTTLAVQFGVERVIENADHAIRTIQSRMRDMDLETLNPARRHAVLFAGLSTTSGSILIMNPEGAITFDSRSVVPRQGFSNADAIIARHAVLPRGAMSVSVPVRARTDGRFVVWVSRSFYTDDGTFGGIIIVVRDLTEIQGLFDLLRIGQRGVVLMVRTDGRLLVRSPDAAIPSGHDVSQSPLFRRIRDGLDEDIVGQSSIDGDERLYVVRHLTNAPLIVGAGISRAEIDATWWSPAWRVVGVGGVLALSLLLVTVMFARELMRRQVAVDRAMAREAEFRILAEKSGDLIVRFDARGQRTYASPAAQRLLGRAPAELLGRQLDDLAHPDDVGTLRDAISRVLRGEMDSVTITFRASHADGRWVWLEGVAQAIRHQDSSLPQGVVEILRDVTERRAREERSDIGARTDSLTGIANRRSLDARMIEAIEAASRDRSAVSILFVDVDFFKKFNDRYGHQAGDECLRAVADAIRSAARSEVDFVGRYGGEEFVVILPHADEGVTDAAAERIRGSIEGIGIPHEGSDLLSKVVTASIGVATARPLSGSRSSDEVQRLIQAADSALYSAKRLGRNRVETTMDPVSALPQDHW